MVKKSNKIYGIMMRPCSATQEANEKIMQGTDYSVTENFYKAYTNHKAAMQIVAECAKIYILKNYQQVKDWSDLEVVMEDNGYGRKGQDFIEYYNYKEHRRMQIASGKRSEIGHKIFSRINEENKLRHNPAKIVTDVVLDTTDGDFSLTVNGNQHNWISDSTVIIIADYIEKQLNTKT